MRFSIRTATIVTFMISFAARADIISPEAEVCIGKKSGDACTTCVDAVDQGTCGTCTVPTPSCQAGACRRFSDEKTCLAEPGCSWAPGPPYCSGSTCACNKKDAALAPATNNDDAKPSSCAAAPVSLSALFLALVFARRRRAHTRSRTQQELRASVPAR